MPYNLDYSHGPVASQRPSKGKNPQHIEPPKNTGATVHKISEEIEWYVATCTRLVRDYRAALFLASVPARFSSLRIERSNLCNESRLHVGTSERRTTETMFLIGVWP